MNFDKAKPSDAGWINEKIQNNFPYVKFTPEKIEEKMKDPKFIIMIAKQVNILTGFAEAELFIETKEARLNGIFVDEAWRDQKIGTGLIERVINQCKHKRIQRIFLLVKTENEGAKHLYTDTGFNFEKMHDKIIDGSKVEVWAQKI